MVSGGASSLVFGFLVATIYGGAFHLLMGGPARRVLLYVLSAWVGFTVGHFVGDMLDIELFKLGVIHLFTASLGAWIALITGWWLSRDG